MTLRHLIVLLTFPGMALAADPTTRYFAETGSMRTALLELFTSEGCSSCPPADALLTDLGGTTPAVKLVPIAFHVDYWDDLGWKDPFARAEYSERQRTYATRHRSRVIYTPQFILSGETLRPVTLLDERLAEITAQPAPRKIRLTATPTSPHRIDVTWEIHPALPEHHRLIVLLTEDGLSSDVRAGENRGRKLRHDHVVRAMQQRHSSKGTTTFTIPSANEPHRLAVVAFIEKPDGTIEQALQLPLRGE